MGELKRLILMGVALVGLTLGLISAASAAVDEQWATPNTPFPGQYSAQIDDAWVGNAHSLLVGDGKSGQFVCTSTKDPACANTESFQITAYLPVCTTEVQLDCIEGLAAIAPDGSIEEAVFSGYTVPNHPNSFPSDSTLKVPEAASSSMWTFEKSAHSTGRTFGLAVVLNGSTSKSQPTHPTQLTVRFAPVLYYDGQGSPLPEPTGPNDFFSYGNCKTQTDTATGAQRIGCGMSGDDLGQRFCSFKLKDPNDCLLRQPFPQDFRYKLRVRMSAQPSGWLHGRMDAPEISITSRSGGGVLLDVTAGSIRVPTFYAGDYWNNLPASIQDFYRKCVESRECWTGARIPNPLNTPRPVEEASVMDNPVPSSSRAMTIMGVWREFSQDKSAAIPSAWTLRTITGGGNDPQGCLNPDTSGLKGIVTTNATAYSDGPPTFDGTHLNYTVMSPHYEPDGKTEFLGRYNLVMRSDVARCLYKFSKAPLQASISVVSSDGNTRVATTTTNEKDGWLRLSAYGFTFSQPTIVVKLTQTPEVAPPATSVPTTVKSAVKKSITCIRGKQTKKFTAAKCPSGWKKR